MSLVFADLVQETTSTTGTGTLTLSGAVSGFQSFAAIGNTNTTYYRIKSGIDSEVGIGTYSLSGATLSRDTVLYSSAGGTTKIDVATGATVSCVYPAERAVYLSETGTLGIGGAAKTTAEVAITEVGLANSGSLAGSALDIAQTWNTTGNPTAIKLNVTNTASGTTSKLMDLQVGGVSSFSVDKSGIVYLKNGAAILSSIGQNGIQISGSNVILGSNAVGAAGSIGTVQALGFGSSAINLLFPDTYLYRDAANTLAQRNSTNSQTSRIYNTYTDASNYERSALSFVTYSGALYTKLAAESAGTGAANIGITLSPKGTGAITAQVPDGTVAGGNARGTYAIDLQFSRSAATQVVSGTGSFAFGSSNLVQNSDSYVFGVNNTLNGTVSSTAAIGQLHTVQASYSIALGGYQNTLSNTYTVAFGNAAKVLNLGQITTGLNRGGGVAGNVLGEAQYSYMGWRGTTTGNTAIELFLMGNSAGSARAVLQDKSAWSAEIDIVARATGGSDIAIFKRRLSIKRETGAANTSLVGTVQTPALDINIGANSPTWLIDLTADTTNGSLKLSVTGTTGLNIYWVAKLSTVEVLYA